MARSPRIEFVGAFYHVMCRGDRREAVFRDDGDHVLFLDTLGEACARTGFCVHAWVLMGNHYHLLIETPEGNLVAGMKWLQGTYTARHNARHKLSGHLFQGRYKALVVDPDEPSYAVTVADYIHLNPVRAGLVREEKELAKWPWSSHRWYSQSRGVPEWMERRLILSELGGPSRSEALRRKRYRAYVARRIAESRESLLHRNGPAPEAAEWTEVREGWVLGGEAFQERMLELAAKAISTGRRESFERRGAAGRHDEREAERMLRSGLEWLKLDEGRLADLKKSDERKELLAWWVRSRTTVSRRWVAGRLSMGHEINVARAVAKFTQPKSPSAKKAREELLRCLD